MNETRSAQAQEVGMFARNVKAPGWLGRRARRRPQRGFTLIEVMLVLAILVIMGSMVTIYFTKVQKSGYAGVAETQINNFKSMLTLYHIDMGSYPNESQGLVALWQDPGNVGNWKGPYCQEAIPLDPWNNPYEYQLIDTDTVHIWSWGPDGVNGTEDDIPRME